MLRAVLAVLVVLAIVGVSQPVISQGRQDHAATLFADEVGEFIETAEDLRKRDEAIRGPGARRIATVELPASDRFSAGAVYVEIRPGEPGTVEWAVEDGPTERRSLAGLDAETPNGDPVRLEAEGEHRLELRLTGPRTDPTVIVERFTPPGAP